MEIEKLRSSYEWDGRANIINRNKKKLEDIKWSLFYEKKWNKIIYKVNAHKKYLSSIQNYSREAICKSTSAIIALQIALKKLGYNVGKINWELQRETILAINKFQKDKKIGKWSIIKSILSNLYTINFPHKKNIKINQHVEPTDNIKKKKKTLFDSVNIPTDRATEILGGGNLIENLWDAPLRWITYPQESLYLSHYSKLNLQEYRDLFSWFRDVQQWNFWDCYLIVAIKTLARSQYFQTLMQTSIQKNKDGSFYLYMPLWEPRWLKIKITPQDINLAKIKWSTWYKILEIWFIKYLLLSKKPIILNDIYLTEDLMQIWVWWNAGVTLRNFLWPKSFKWISIPNTFNNRKAIYFSLKNFNPKAWIVITASSNRRKSWNAKTYSTSGWDMRYHHAYSVFAVEKQWKNITAVTLEDPANSKKKIRLPLNEFLRCISSIDYGKFTNNFLNLHTGNDEIKIVNSMNGN